jgi:flagella basal body P-ring formation protein FlgA
MLLRSSKSRHALVCSGWLALSLTAALASSATPAASDAPGAAGPATIENIPELEAIARVEALRQLPQLTEKQRIEVGPLPPQVRLARCEHPVKPARAPGLPTPGRVLIELRCEGHAPWHVYVPVKVVGTTPVVTAAHAIIAGTVLTAKDLATQQHDLTALPPGYLDDPGIALGLTAARAIAGGSILTNQELLGLKAVQHGQTVTLVADAGGISVRMEGRALTDGLVNQRVKVMNLSSGRVVEGIARSAQVVEIIF